MVGGADHPGEHRAARPAGARLGLAVIEEGVADSLPAVLGQQHALAEIEHARRIDPVRGVAYILMVQRTNFPNSDASDVRRAFQQAAADALAAK